MHKVVDVVICISAKAPDGTEHHVKVGLGGSLTYAEVFAAAHQNADGSWPILSQCASAELWSVATNLRRAEERLHAMAHGSSAGAVSIQVGNRILETALAGERLELPGPLRRWRGLSWVGWLNRLVLRWFFVRLGYVVESDNTISKYFLHRWVWPFPWSRWKRIGASTSPESAP